jgi:spermidine/putrescine transport system permease protein
MSVIRRHRWLQGLLLMGPAAIWALLFVIAPTVIAVCMSLWKIVNYRLVHDWHLGSYGAFIHTSIYYEPLFVSLENGALVAAISVVLSLLLAHFIRFHVHKHRLLFFGSVVIALWLGYLLRIFGWRIALGREGIINSLLIDLGLISHPLSFLVFSRFAVILVQTHLAMPFAFIPVYAAMERLPNHLMHAAADLGGNRRRQFVHVELPLIAPGVVAGATFAFVLAFGDYFAPNLVGSPGGVTIGNIAADQFGEAFDWPLGAAIGVIMIATVIVAIGIPGIFGFGRRLVWSVRDRRDERWLRLARLESPAWLSSAQGGAR